jgi:hypothetical protein
VVALLTPLGGERSGSIHSVATSVVEKLFVDAAVKRVVCSGPVVLPLPLLPGILSTALP